MKLKEGQAVWVKDPAIAGTDLFGGSSSRIIVKVGCALAFLRGGDLAVQLADGKAAAVRIRPVGCHATKADVRPWVGLNILRRVHQVASRDGYAQGKGGCL